METRGSSATPAGVPPAAAAGGVTREAAPFRSAALYVGDLHPDVAETTLFEIFNAVAPVASVRVCRHAITRASLGYAYVNFHTIQAAERVLDTMNYTQIKGRQCRIMWSQRDPSLRRSGRGNIFIKNLSPEIDSKDLYDTFSLFGNIVSCKVKVDPMSGESRGYGFVHFETEEAADEAIEKVNGKIINGKNVFVGHFQTRADRIEKAEWTNLYIKFLPPRFTEADVRALFEPFGEVSSCIVMAEGDGKSKRFGFVDFKEHAAAVAASEALHKRDMSEFYTPEDDAIIAAAAEAAAAEAAGGAAEAGAEGDKDEAAPKKPIKEAPKWLYVRRFQKRRERVESIRERKEARRHERIKEMLGKNLYVKNLADGVTDEVLREHFAEYGSIVSALVKSSGGRSRGFGFVCLSTREEAANAMSRANNSMLKGKPISVTLWQPRDERRRHIQAQMTRRAAGGIPMMRGIHMGNMGMPGFGGVPGGSGFGRPDPRMFAAVAAAGGGVPPGGPRGGPGGFPPHAGAGMMGAGGYPGGAGVAPGGAGAGGRPMMGGGVPPAGAAAGAGGAAPPPGAPAPLTARNVAAASPEEAKNMIGNELFPRIHRENPELAGKITGMLLEGMDTAELLHLLESPQALKSKIEEAKEVLHNSSLE